MRYPSRKGQTFLTLVFLIGAVVAVVALLVAFFASSFADTGYGLAAQTSAEAAANSGVEDALLQLERNMTFNVTSSYSLAVGSSTANVVVTQNSPSAGYVTILSTATVANHKRKVQAVVSENTVTAQINVVSWQDVQ